MNKVIGFIAVIVLSISAFATQATTLSVDFSLPKFGDKNYRKPYEIGRAHV